MRVALYGEADTRFLVYFYLFAPRTAKPASADIPNGIELFLHRLDPALRWSSATPNARVHLLLDEDTAANRQPPKTNRV
jgi:hypothetical protein